MLRGSYYLISFPLLFHVKSLHCTLDVIFFASMELSAWALARDMKCVFLVGLPPPCGVYYGFDPAPNLIFFFFPWIVFLFCRNHKIYGTFTGNIVIVIP